MLTNRIFKINILLIAFFFVFLTHVSFAEPFSLSLEDLANIFSTYFPKVEGSLLRIEEGKGVLNLGEKNGLVKGIVLEIIRQGGPFYHPVTHEVMGNFEEKVGFIELERIDDEESQGTVLYFQNQKPVPGDKVRISSARIPVKITGEPEKKNLVAIDEFSRLLLETDRFLLPFFTKLKSGSDSIGGNSEPLYEFKVHSLPDQTIQVELNNLPFQYKIEQLTATTNGTFQ